MENENMLILGLILGSVVLFTGVLSMVIKESVAVFAISLMCAMILWVCAIFLAIKAGGGVDSVPGTMSLVFGFTASAESAFAMFVFEKYKMGY